MDEEDRLVTAARRVEDADAALRPKTLAEFVRHGLAVAILPASYVREEELTFVPIRHHAPHLRLAAGEGHHRRGPGGAAGRDADGRPGRPGQGRPPGGARAG